MLEGYFKEGIFYKKWLLSHIIQYVIHVKGVCVCVCVCVCIYIYIYLYIGRI
jgi:hypothetical protein